MVSFVADKEVNGMGSAKTEGSSALKERRVIKIEATSEQKAKKLRVAAYARVSSDSSDQLNSFMAQTDYYATLISSHEDWTMADIYADEGISGTSALKRPEFQRLISDCKKGRIDRILVKSISRFARNTKDCLETIRALKSIGVSVYFEEQNIDTAEMSGELLTAVFAGIAQKESESISGNMRWSYKHRMQTGTYLPSSTAYGYVIRDMKTVIDEAKAEVVRQIFSDYLNGMNMYEIADKLNRAQIPYKCNTKVQKWKHTTIAYILSNEKYIGDSLWQKSYTTQTLPAKQMKNKGECEQYYATGTHPPIIDRQTFKAAQELRARRRQPIDNTGIDSAFNQIICCEHCGSLFRKKLTHGVRFWICRNHAQSKDACPVSQILESELHRAFLRVYHKLKIHGDQILQQMVSDLQSVRERRMLWSVDVIELNKRISELTDQDHTLAEMKKLGFVDPDIFISQSNEIARQIAAAKQEKERLVGLSNDESVPKTRELIELLEEMPEFIADFDDDIFGCLVSRIIVESNERIRFVLKNGLEIPERIERAMR